MLLISRRAGVLANNNRVHQSGPINSQVRISTQLCLRSVGGGFRGCLSLDGVELDRPCTHRIGRHVRGSAFEQAYRPDLRLRCVDSYLLYYHEDRTHLGLAKDTPAGRPTAIRSRLRARLNPSRDSAGCTIVMQWQRRVRNHSSGAQTLFLVTHLRRGLCFFASMVRRSTDQPTISN